MCLAYALLFATANLTTAGTVINGTEAAVIHINDSISSVNVLFTGDGNVAEFTDGEALATISPDVLDDVADGKAALSASEDLVADSTVEVAE